MALKHKTIWIGLLLLVFIILSAFRYHQVNEPFRSYKVDEISLEENEWVDIGELQLSYGSPKVVERETEFYYEIPLTIKNEGDKIQQRPLDRFYLYGNYTHNMLSVEAFTNHPENEELAPEGIQPNSTEELMLIFVMRKEWGISQQTEINLYFLNNEQKGMLKYAYRVK